MQEKNSWIKKRNHPPVYIKENLHNFNLEILGKFDVILCDPPWKQYEKRGTKSNRLNEKPEHYKGIMSLIYSLDSKGISEVKDQRNRRSTFFFIFMGRFRASLRWKIINEGLGV